MLPRTLGKKFGRLLFNKSRAEMLRHTPSAIPRCELRTGGRYHPLTDDADIACSLREWNEIVRRHKSASGMLPANERFDLHGPPRGQIDFRLIEQDELIALDRAAQFA